MSDSPTELKIKVAAGRARFTVTFYIGAGYLNADCDCPAGKYGNFCQHRLKLLRGDGSEIVGDSLNDLEIIIGKGIDKLTSSVIGMWEYLAQLDRKTHSEWAFATTCGALRPLSGSASPRLQVNLSIPFIEFLLGTAPTSYA